MKRDRWLGRGRLVLFLALLFPGLVGTGGLGDEIPNGDVLIQLTGTTLTSLTQESPHRLEAPAPGSYLTPRMVKVKTRVVTGDGTRATNFSVLVGTNQYVATPLASGPGDSRGFHLLVLERSTLAVVTNCSGSTPEFSSLALNGILKEWQSREDLLVVFYEMNAAGADPISNPLAVTLSNFGASSNALYNPANNHFSPTYAFIGNAGLSTNRSFEVSGFVNPDATGRMEITLARDLRGNYFPIDPRFVTLQTSTGAGANTVLVRAHSATNAVVAPALQAGASGGFQLVVARRDILDQAPTNSAAILTNLTFSTGDSIASDATAAMQGLLAALEGYQGQLASGQVLLALTSLGSPMPASPSGDFQSALNAVSAFLQSNVGAVADLGQCGSGGYYSLVGIPWISTNESPLSVEIRSWTPSGTNATALNVVLQGNPKGWFDPVAADITGGVDYRLYEIASRDPVPWPVAPSAGSGPCDAGDEACLAYQWISTNIAENVAIPSIRDTYLDEESNFSGYRQNLESLPYNPALAPYFSAEIYGAVSNQLSRELFYMGFVQKLHGQLSTLVSDLATDQNAGLIGAVGAVIGQVAPPSAATVGFSLDAELRFIAQLGAALDPDPVSKAALGVASAGLSFAMQKKTTAAGNGDNRVEAAVSGLATAISTNMNDNLVGLGEVFRDIVTDWGKMSEVAVLTQGPSGPDNGFAWQDGTSGDVLNSMLPAFNQLFYAELMPTLYQRVFFQNVPFTNPDAYFYRHDCVTWRFTICECATDLYQPPAFDYYQPPGTANLWVIATAARNYPTSALVQTGLPVNAQAYLPDLFQGLGRWSGVLPQVLPVGWNDYLNNQSGVCDNYLGFGVNTDGSLELGFRTRVGERYQLERSMEDLGNWSPLGDPVVAQDIFHVVRVPMVGIEDAYFRLQRLN
ncbi:MAG: hypothetical protein JNL10_19490 [Verrucomicrobiales bacterium]|nr:hypothetical protein [Verrucomicrobiales bacterium]